MEPKKISLTERGKELVAHSVNFRESEQLYMIEEPGEDGYAVIAVDSKGSVFTHMHKDNIIMEQE